MEWLKEELQAWYYLLVGIAMLGIGALFSDLFTGAVDKLWKKDDSK